MKNINLEIVMAEVKKAASAAAEKYAIKAREFQKLACKIAEEAGGKVGEEIGEELGGDAGEEAGGEAGERVGRESGKKAGEEIMGEDGGKVGAEAGAEALKHFKIGITKDRVAALKRLFAEVGTTAGKEASLKVVRQAAAKRGEEDGSKFAYEHGRKAGAAAARKLKDADDKDIRE